MSANWDEDRRMDAISDEEIKGLVGQRETQWFEFKAMGYRGKDDGGYEICKDITAMANASGGYIFVGIGTKDSVATGFRDLEDVDKEINLVKSHCDRIEPRVAGLEVVKRTVETKGKQCGVLAIHVPPSNNRPHAFYHVDRTIFVKREDDHVRRFPMLEIREAFAARDIPEGHRFRAGGEQGRPVEADDNALVEDDPERLIGIMQQRFAKEIGEEPFYRIFVLPTKPDATIVDTNRLGVREVLQSPRDIRTNGFGFRSLIEVKPTGEGVRGHDLSTELQVRLLRNGFFEVRYPLRGHHFQWRSDRYGYVDRWLYPYSVCEYPVSVLRVVRQLFTEAGYTGDLMLRQEYWNAKGFVLSGGHPSGPNFGWKGWTEELGDTRIRGTLRRIPSDFNPDATAHTLVVETYNAFGLDEKFIPLFDSDRNFRA